MERGGLGCERRYRSRRDIKSTTSELSDMANHVSPHQFTDPRTKSYFDFDFDKGKARFHGDLDIETLGGAGFASQRTTGDDREYDLSEFAGIQLEVAKGDSM